MYIFEDEENADEYTGEKGEQNKNKKKNPKCLIYMFTFMFIFFFIYQIRWTHLTIICPPHIITFHFFFSIYKIYKNIQGYL